MITNIFILLSPTISRKMNFQWHREIAPPIACDEHSTKGIITFGILFENPII